MSALIGLAERLGLRVCSGPWRQAAAAAGLRPWPNHQEQPHQCQQQRRFSTIDEHKDEVIAAGAAAAAFCLVACRLALKLVASPASAPLKL